ncbi:TetR/AcrR family transcriptional regulator [Pyxidicoccus xibeiensis]|uniref:TetR/AcrR family transcriptional regulator n=1 Tax=Pyxidicoccus xibeiensis TaxID=2906759 RepID=UPI003899F8C0
MIMELYQQFVATRMEEAAAVMAQRGYDNTPAAELARVMRMSVGSLYRRYGSKRGCALAIRDFSEDELCRYARYEFQMASTDEGAGFREGFFALWRLLANYVLRTPGVFSFVFLHVHPEAGPDDERGWRVRDLIREVVSQAERDGALEPGSAMARTCLVWGALAELGRVAARWEGAVTEADVLASAEALWRALGPREKSAPRGPGGIPPPEGEKASYEAPDSDPAAAIDDGAAAHPPPEDEKASGEAPDCDAAAAIDDGAAAHPPPEGEEASGEAPDCDAAAAMADGAAAPRPGAPPVERKRSHAMAEGGSATAAREHQGLRALSASPAEAARSAAMTAGEALTETHDAPAAGRSRHASPCRVLRYGPARMRTPHSGDPCQATWQATRWRPWRSPRSCMPWPRERSEPPGGAETGPTPEGPAPCDPCSRSSFASASHRCFLSLPKPGRMAGRTGGGGPSSRMEEHQIPCGGTPCSRNPQMQGREARADELEPAVSPSANRGPGFRLPARSGL